MGTIRPTLLVGLGQQGAELAYTISGALGGHLGAGVDAVATLGLDDSGDWRFNGGEVAARCPELCEKPGAWRENHAAFTKNVNVCATLLAELIGRLTSHELRAVLQDGGLAVGEGLGVWVCTPVADPIGSTAIIPFLRALLELRTGRLRGTLIDCGVLAFLPDLFSSTRHEEWAYARAYSCLRELSYVAEHPEVLAESRHAPYGNVFLFGSKNEDGVELGDPKPLGEMIGLVLAGLLTERYGSDTSYSYVLAKRVHGQVTRYSSLGMGRLVFPTPLVMRGLADHVTLRLLDLAGVAPPEAIDANAIAVAVKKFLLDHQLDTVLEQLARDTAGATSWHEFKYGGALHEEVLADTFLADVEVQAAEFDRCDMTEMAEALGRQRAARQTHYGRLLAERVKALMDQLDSGIHRADAFLARLLGETAELVSGAEFVRAYTLADLDVEAKRRFDAAHGVDRTAFLRLGQDLQVQREALHACVRELDRLRAMSEEQDGEHDSSSAGAEVEGARRRQEELETAVEALEQRHGALAGQIDGIDGMLRDAVRRRDFADRVCEQELADKNALELACREMDQKHREGKRRLRELYDERQRFLRRMFVLWPAIGTAAYVMLAAAVLYSIDAWSLASGLKVTAGVFGAGLLGYAVWAGVKYWNGPRRAIHEAETEQARLRSLKERSLLDVQDWYNRRFRLLYEHALHVGRVELLAEFRRDAVVLRRNVGRFLRGLEESRAAAAASFEQLEFPNTVFVRNVVTREDIARFIATNRHLEAERQVFFEKRSLGSYFEEFCRTGDLGPFLRAAAEFAEESFQTIRNYSIEAFLEDETQAGRMRAAERITRLYESTKACVLLDIERGQDGSQAFVYLGVSHPSESLAKSVLVAQGHKNLSVQASAASTEIEVVRIKVGFPAFHVAAVQYGRAILNRIGDLACTVNEAWSAEDLIPSEFTIGTQDDPVRRMLCLGRVFALIEQRSGRLVFQDVDLGSSDREAVQSLRHSSGGATRDRLVERIEAVKQTAGALDALISHRTAGALDEIDRRIVDTAINEISGIA